MVFLLAKVHQRAQAVLKKHLQVHGLTPMQCLILESLLEEEGLPVGDIGRRLTLDTATLAGVLDRMVTAGWVRRESDPTDGRIARIYLTDRANEVTADLIRSIEQANNELLENFSPVERVLLMRFLRDMKN
jgi:DNA-binding MarR family transcriptional regulator